MSFFYFKDRIFPGVKSNIVYNYSCGLCLATYIAESILVITRCEFLSIRAYLLELVSITQNLQNVKFIVITWKLEMILIRAIFLYFFTFSGRE